MKRLLQVIGLSVILQGCMVGPDYRTPETAMPQEFVEKGPGVTTSFEKDCTEWWKQFQDPFLDALIAEAMQANYDFRIAVEKIVQARAQYRVQGSYLWPEIDLDVIATRTRNSQTLFSSPTPPAGAAAGIPSAASTSALLPTFQNFFHVGFDAMWEFDLFGKFRRSKKAAYYDWEASKENAQDVLISVVSEVARNYVNICAIQNQIALTEKKIEIDEAQLNLTARLFESGLNSQIEVETLLSALEAERAVIPQLEGALKQTIYALATLLGRQPENLVQEFAQTRPIPIGSDKIPVGLPADLLRRRPDIKRVERQLASATELIGVAMADLFPHVVLTGITFSGSPLPGSSYGYESDRLNTLFKPASRAWTIGPAIRWDIIDFGKVKGNINVQKSLQKQALLTYEKTVINALKDVEGALAVYFQEQKRTLFYAEQIAALKRSLNLTEDLYRAGLADDQTVLNARRNTFDAELSLIVSEEALTSDLIAVYKALGGEWQCSYSP